MRYEIQFTAAAHADLDTLRPFDRAAIFDAIEASLRFEPTTRARNRRPVEPVGQPAELGITWELVVGAFRVFYDVEPYAAVIVIRIVRKGRRTTDDILK